MKGLPQQRPVTRSFNVFFDLRQNKRLSKQSRPRWFETPSRSLWRHCNVTQGKYHPSWRFTLFLFHIHRSIPSWYETIVKIDRENPEIQCHDIVEVTVHDFIVGPTPFKTCTPFAVPLTWWKQTWFHFIRPSIAFSPKIIYLYTMHIPLAYVSVFVKKIEVSMYWSYQ